MDEMSFKVLNELHIHTEQYLILLTITVHDVEIWFMK